MKPKFRHLRSLAIASSVMLCVSSASAQTDYFWDQNGATAGTGGTGAWNTSDNFWRSVSATGTLGPWVNAGAAPFNTATFGGTAGTVTLGTGITAGGLTFTTGGYTITGNTLTLAGTSAPIINATTGTTTITSIIAGTDGFQKSGGGTLVLNTASTFSGGVNIAAGTIQMSTATNSASLFGVSGNTITFSGNSTIQTVADGTYSFGQNITINNGVTGTLRGAFGESMVGSGVVAGSGTLQVQGDSNGFGVTLNNANNTFTGAITVVANATTSLSMASLGSSANAITLSNAGQVGVFTYTGSAAVNRGFVMGGTTGGSTINASGAGALTLTSFSAPNNGAKTLTLGGTSTAINTFQGNIVNSASGATALTKADSGTWALSGTNTYSGLTTMGQANPSGNGLTFQGIQALSPNTDFTQTHAGGSGGHGAFRILDDSATPASRSGVDLTFNHSNNSQNSMVVFVGNNSVANGGTSASTQTGSTIQLGSMNFNQSNTGQTAGTQLYVSGANGYKLEIANVNVTLQGTHNANWNAMLNADAPIIVTGTVRQTNDAGASSATTLQLRGGAQGSLISGNILNSAGGRLMNVNKASAGTWSLSGTNAYTGTTTVSDGILRITGNSSAATGNVSVTAGSLGGNAGSLGGAVTVSSTGGLDLRDGSVGSLTLGSTLNITGAAGANNLRFDMGNGVVTNDRIDVAGATTVTNAGAAVIDLNWLGGASGRTVGTYTLIGGAGALDATNFAKFSLGFGKAFGQTYTLVHDLVSDGGTGNLQVTAANATALTPAAFWAGTTSVNWSAAANWRDTLAGGGAVVGAPDFATNVTFSTTSPTPGNLATVLDTGFDINSLTFTNASGNVTIAGPGALVLEAAAVNGNTLGNGINSLKTSGTNTISARVALASSQTWTVASGGTLAVSGVISDFGLGYGLTKAGGGNLTISANPTYTGATTYGGGGTLDVSGISGNPLSNTSGLTFNSGSSNFTYAAANISLPSTTISPGATANFRNVASGGIFTFTIPSLSGSGTFSGDNPGGTGQNKIIAFSDLSNFTGVLQMSTSGSSFIYQLSNLNDTVANNIRFAGNAQALANPDRLRYVGSAGLTLTNRAIELAKGANSFVAIDNNGTNNSSLIINSNLAVTTAGAKTLILGGTNTGGTSAFAGNIVNGSGTISLTKADANTWSLTSANNSYTGGTTISAGTLVIGGAGRLGSGSYAGAISNAGALRYSSSADQTFSGVISGAGSLTKDTSTTSTLTLNTSTNSYTGATNVHAGTLTFAGSSSGTLGAITVGGAGTPVLNIQAGSYTQGAGGFFVGGGAGGAGIVNQTGGTVAWNSNSLQLLIGNGGFGGTYNLSGGSLTTLTGTNTRGVIIGTNSDSTNTFNLSGTGALTVAGTSRLMIGRSDATQTNTTNLFSQTGGTATISDMTMGGTSGGAGSGNSATLSLTGGTFTAAAFSLLSAANNDVSTINIGGTAVVTLPNLPTLRGTSTTATINFDGGTLRNSATGTFITGLTNAFIRAGGAQFDTSLNSTTISQALLTHGSSTGGGLTKLGANNLTLSGANTYTGATTVTGGSLIAGVASVANVSGAFGNNSAVSLANTAGVSLDITGFNTQIGSLSGGGATGGNVTLGAATLTIAGNNASPVTYAGVISSSGAGGLTKIGTGTQILSGDNTYTGATTVSNGILRVNGSHTGGGAYEVASSGTLQGIGSTTSALNVSGVLSPGASIETFGTGALSFATGSTLAHELDSSVGTSVGSDLLKVTGNLNLAGTVGLTLSDLALTDVAFNVDDVFSVINYTGTWNGGLFTFGGNELADAEEFTFGLNTWRINYAAPTGGLNFAGEHVAGSFVNLTVIPEPSSVALLGTLGAMMLLRRRR